MKRKVIRGVLVLFIVSITTWIISFYTDLGSVKYLIYLILMGELIVILILILRKRIRGEKIIRLLIPLLIVIIIVLR